jgi:hypothetical protein
MQRFEHIFLNNLQKLREAEQNGFELIFQDKGGKGKG